MPTSAGKAAEQRAEQREPGGAEHPGGEQTDREGAATVGDVQRRALGLRDRPHPVEGVLDGDRHAEGAVDADDHADHQGRDAAGERPDVLADLVADYREVA